MANLLVEIGNTALKAAWSERMTLGKAYRYQGEKYIEFIQSLTQREKPAVMVVSSVYPVSQADEALLKQECSFLLVLDSRHRGWLAGHGLQLAGAAYLFVRGGERGTASAVYSEAFDAGSIDRFRAEISSIPALGADKEESK